MSEYTVARVRWVDSSFHRTDGWLDRVEFEEWAGKASAVCETVGFLAWEGEGHVVIALTVSDAGGVVDFVKIPRACILELARLAHVTEGMAGYRDLMGWEVDG